MEKPKFGFEKTTEVAGFTDADLGVFVKHWESARDQALFFLPSCTKELSIRRTISHICTVQVCWLNDTSAYVALNRPDQAKLVQKSLTQSDSYTVIQYSIYQRHESSCQCGRTYGKAVLACISMTKSLTQLVVSSPTTTNLRKRRSLELQQSETHEKQLIALKKRSRSSGETTDGAFTNMFLTLSSNVSNSGFISAQISLQADNDSHAIHGVAAFPRSRYAVATMTAVHDILAIPSHVKGLFKLMHLDNHGIVPSMATAKNHHM
uniref:Poly(A)-specific ribonuclease RNA-binding domain-containing protein n=1 Tax=Timema cristinae TaxID=61476 RepID=A0A7R9GVN7_TIMCR|nr:unnamed protein product [Timema cristinae]